MVFMRGAMVATRRDGSVRGVIVALRGDGFYERGNGCCEERWFCEGVMVAARRDGSVRGVMVAARRTIQS
jgi:hypothetical protein